MENKLIRAFTGSEIEVVLLQGELEGNGILSTTHYGSTFAMSPVYGGAPVELDLFIEESELEKANPIIEEYLRNRDSVG